jgi:hypothetical protein
MKVLVVLCIAQLILIALLFLRVLGVESALNASRPMATSASPVTSTATAATRPGTTSVALVADEQRLREIIREELAAQARNPGGPATAASIPEGAVPADPVMDRDYDYRLDSVQQSLDFYAQVGEISQAEMLQLQTEIAKLRPEDRTAMFSRLVRELNNGAIDGRL